MILRLMGRSRGRQGREYGLREKAAECRVLAAVTKDPEIREQLLEVADQFERLARHYLFVRMTTPPSEGRQ
jgi:hypothetical protein